MIDAGVSFEPATFADLQGWPEDDHLAALQAFRRSCPKLGSAADLTRACAAAVEGAGPWSSVRARAFFEAYFRPHRVVHRADEGLLTGYYEPEIAGALVRGEGYTVPVYRRPPDLENLVAEAQRGAKADSLTHARRTAAGLEPYATRAQIDQGALAGRGLELAYVRCPVDLFFMQVQGSGVIRLPDGARMRVTYDGKNGHPYTSIGRYLVDAGELPPEPMSLEILADWLRQDLVRAAPVMWQNASYVFFREIPPSEADGPLGVEAIPLTARAEPGGRRRHACPRHAHLGVVAEPDARDRRDRVPPPDDRPGRRFGDPRPGARRHLLRLGSEAGRLAGITRHPGRFFVLLPA